MPLDPAACGNERLAVAAFHLTLTWDSPAPAGTWFQVYVDRVLTVSTRSRRCHLPLASALARIDVGAVAAGESLDDFSASLPVDAGGGDRAALSWLGGTYLAPDASDDVEGYAIYGEPAPGAGIDRSRRLAFAAAYPAGILADGAGMGPAGRGGAGRAASAYRWTSGRLAAGTWHFEVRAATLGGIEGPAAAAVVAIVAPPRPPSGVAVAYDPGAGTAALSWTPSPDA